MVGLTRITHIFFDLDDTVYDFRTNSSAVMQTLYDEENFYERLKVPYEVFMPLYREINLAYWTMFHRGQIQREELRYSRFIKAFNHFGYTDEAEIKRLTEIYMSRAPLGKTLMPGCTEALSLLKPNFQLGIITNGFTAIQNIKLDSGNLRPFFNHLLISEELNLSKPDTRIFRHAEAICKARPENCLMVGDNYESDVEGAVNAGWEAVHIIREKESSPHPVAITDLRQLLPIIAKLI